LKPGRDAWAGLAVLAASLVLFWLTLALKENPLVPIGPGFYPRIVLGLTVVLAAILVVADALAQRPVRPPRAEPLRYGMVALMFAAFGLYCGALPYFGFRIATFAYVAGTNALLDAPRRARDWLRVGLVGLIATAVIYYAFERYLSVLLPRGLWTDF